MRIRSSLVSAIVVVLTWSLCASAEDKDGDEHAGHRLVSGESKPDSRMGIKAIEELMARIRAEPEREARRQLLAQHLNAMRGQMRAIRVADDPHSEHRAKAAETDDSGKVGMKDRKMKGGGMMKMHKKVEDRLEMLERVLQQLIENESIEREIEQE